MLTLSLVINCLIAVLVLVIGATVILKNGRSSLNRSFFYFCLFLSLWIVTNFFSNSDHLSIRSVRMFNHLVLFFSGLAVVAIYGFTSQLTGFLKKRFRWAIFAGIFGSFLALTPLVVMGVERQDEVYAIKFGVLSPLYFTVVIVGFFIVIITLLKALKRENGAAKRRLKLMLLSIGATIIIAVTTNAILPILTGSFSSTVIGPLSTIIMVIGISYAIIKHQLFDIRLVIARTMAYALSLFTLGVLYSLFSFFIVNKLLFRDVDISILQEVIYTMLAVVLVFTFQPAKRFFDHYSNRFFYSDNYDPQFVLDQLSGKLVGLIHLNKLIEESTQIIVENLKLSFVVFVITEESRPPRVVGNLPNINTKWINSLVDKIKDPFVVRELLEQDSELSRVMRKQNIAVITQLASHNKSIGYILLGDKKSGSIYTPQDLRLISILSDELTLAILSGLQFEEIERFNITLQQKVDDATRQLRKTNEKLKILDATKDEFISMASHQLRTPLTSVKGYVSMVLEGDAGKVSKEQRSLLDQAYLSSQRMVYLIADLLNVSRLHTGKFVIEKKPTQLAEVIDGELRQLEETAKGRKISLTYHRPKDFPLLMLDETKTRQVIMNFADNAIYYTPNGGKIDINLVDKGSNIEFTVVDNGIGVPKAEQHHMFTKFYRANNAQKARPDGTGLGLFMAKKVVVAQGGAIIFHSQEGKGSTFGFTFPKSGLLAPKGTKVPAN